MENFKKPRRHKRPNTLDGIVSRAPSRQGGSLSFNRQPKSPHPQTVIGDFKRPDGFHAAQQPVIQTGADKEIPKVQKNDGFIEEPINEPRRKSKVYKRKLSWKKVVKRGALVSLILMILIPGFIFAKGYLKARNLFKGGAAGAASLNENVDPNLLKGEGDGRINLMLLGRGGAGHTAPDLTDTILIASIDPINKEAALLSIPRDFYVKIPGNGSTKLNSVFANEKSKALAKTKKTTNDIKEAEKTGLNSVQKTLEQTLGIPLHYYVMVDFEAFRKAIDTVGGVTINVPETLYDPSVAWENNNNPTIAKKGVQTMNGKTALLYARSRMTSSRGDFDRAIRQREIIMGLKDKVLSLGTFSNPVKITQLIDAFGNHMQTNLALNEVTRLYSIGKDIATSKIASISLADPPTSYVTTSFVNGQSVVIPKAGLYNYKDIQNFVRNALKDGFIKKENPSIAILNGTSSTGLATKKADELKSYGYNVTTVTDAPTKNYTKTVLVDMRNGQKKYTKHYLEQRFNTTATTKLPDAAINPGTADFVIILGQSEVN